MFILFDVVSVQGLECIILIIADIIKEISFLNNAETPTCKNQDSDCDQSREHAL